MKAMVLREFNRPLTLETVPDPVCGPEDLILAVSGCGVCATDLKIIAGHVRSVRLPHLLGHEIAGVVAAVGAQVTDVRVGDKVCAHMYVPCLECANCRAGRTNICLTLSEGKVAGRLGFEWPGGFAEFVRVPARVAVPLPTAAAVEDLCICADAIATPYHALHARLGVVAGQTLVLLGAGGGVGVHAVQIARTAGTHIIAVDRGAERLRFARDLGADECVDTAAPGGWEALLRRGRFADAVLDFAGSPDLGAAATQVLKAGGRYVIVGYQYGEAFPLPYQPTVSFELDFLGARASTMADLRATVALIVAGRVRPIVGARLPLHRANEALESIRTMQRPGRVVLMP
jgi:D-arabinose 1-dehydrogenase-like Zn-dependent alcohol dehydrogenase